MPPPKKPTIPKIRISSVQHKGELEREAVWLHAAGEENLKGYVLIRSYYRESGALSHDLVHGFWFPETVVKAGDWVLVYTKNGRPHAGANAKGTTTHRFYLNWTHAIWTPEASADCVVLIKAGSISHKKA